jgi:hypothetical protein
MEIKVLNHHAVAVCSMMVIWTESKSKTNDTEIFYWLNAYKAKLASQ